MKLSPESILQHFFSSFFFFGVKLGHFNINKFFSVCNKKASLPAKNGEILCQRRKKVWQDQVLVSISSTFQREFCIQKRIAQLSLVTFKLCNFWRQNFVLKQVSKTMMKLTTVLNFINIRLTAFTHADPKSVKRYLRLD